MQAYTREPRERERYTQAVQRALATARKRIGTTALLTALVILLSFGAITLVLWAGAHQVIAGEMNAGVLAQFVLYAVVAAGSVGGLTEVWGELLRCAGALGRIGELLDTDAEIRSPDRCGAADRPGAGRVAFRARRVSLPVASRSGRDP